jgi:Domain of unknown function (DUF3850)
VQYAGSWRLYLEREGEMMTEHRVKTWPEYYQAVKDGRKTFEIRNNDRNYREGDIVHLLEFDPDTQLYSGNALSFRVGYVLKNTLFLPKGFVAFSLLPIKKVK